MVKQARALRTHDRVLDAAAYEFARYGYANTNLQRIADRIGLTKGALYGHFSTKEELAAALTDHLSRSVRVLLGEAGTSSSGPPLSRLESLVLGFGKLLETDRRAQAALRLDVDAARASETAAPVLDSVRQAALQLVREVQRGGQWDASLPAVPLADLIVAAFCTAFRAGLGANRERPAPSVAAMWDVLCRTLGAGSPARTAAGAARTGDRRW